MEILSKANYDRVSKKHSNGLIIFLILLLAGIVAYIFSFFTGQLYISLLVGISFVIICSFVYFSAVYENSKLLKLFKNSKIGINQEEKYTFIKYDGETERDGIKLNRIICTFIDDKEKYERTLYSVSSLPFCKLKENNDYCFTTYQNIIIAVKE